MLIDHNIPANILKKGLFLRIYRQTDLNVNMFDFYEFEYA